MRLWKSTLALVTAFGLSAILSLSETQQTDERNRDTIEDRPKVLDSIRVTGSTTDPGPTSGRMYLRGLILTSSLLQDIERDDVDPNFRLRGFQGRRGNNNVSQYGTYVLTFTEVQFASDDKVLVDGETSGPKRFSYRSSLTDPTALYAMDMPEGTYALTEIRFVPRPQSQTNFNLQEENARSIVRRTYCVAEKTFLFDVFAGESAFLGSFAFEDPPLRASAIADHTPIVGFIQDTEELRSQLPAFGDGNEPPLVTARMEEVDLSDQSGACRTSGAFQVPAWQSPDS